MQFRRFGKSIFAFCATTILAIGLTTASDPSDASDEFKIDVTVTAGGETATALIYLIDGNAFVLQPGEEPPVAIAFDLSKKSWREMDTGRVITLQQAEEWAKASRKQTQVSLESLKDDRQRRFVSALLDPKFSINERDGHLVLKNEFLTFDVTPTKELPKARIDRLAMYDRLNAYHKAMTQHQLMPFTQLAVTEELIRRRAWAETLELEVRGRDSNLELKSRMKLSDLTDSERDKGLKALKDAQAYAKPVE